MNKNTAVIILAAGKSTRMKSDIPKVLHPICGRPVLEYVLDLVDTLKAKEVIAVLGYKHQEVRKILRPGIKVAIQKKLRGTADAVKTAMPLLKNFKGTILVLYADNPLLKKETIKKLLERHINNNADATLLTAKVNKPEGYGRILRDKYASISGIVEEKDASDFQKSIKEINTGIVCFNKEKLAGSLKSVRAKNAKKEFYLTDVIGLLYGSGGLVGGVDIGDINESLGINSRAELAQANKIMQKRLQESWMREGVTIIDPDSTFISYGVKIGRDTTIYPFTVIEKDVKIGGQCSVGPFAHVRPGTFLDNNVTVGNFIEVSRSRFSARSRAKHFGFIGDARVGPSVNIGAGTVTANYDGKNKNITRIGEKAFIGSDTVLVAPVKIGKRAKTGAGSVVTRNRDVPGGVTVVGVPARPIKKSQ